MSTKIEIVVDYTNGLKSITVDNIDMDNISYVAKLPIDKWNTPSGGRANWKGLIEEIKALVADDVAELAFDFHGSDEDKNVFRACFGEKIDGLDEDEYVARRRNDAQKAEHTGDYFEALENYISIAKRCEQASRYYQAADYAYSIYIGEKNCDKTGNVELLQTYCVLFDKAISIVKASQDASLALESANKVNFILDQTVFSDVVDINKYIDVYIELLEQAGTQGANEAKRMLFDLYKEGNLVEQNKEKAFEWLLKLGEAEENEAQLQIADYYFEGGFVDQNHILAFDWYTKAAKNGNMIASRKLALCYEEGYGCDKNLRAAFDWYCVATEAGDDDSKLKKAIMLYHGQGTIQNKARAFDLFSELAEKGSVEANFMCGCYHEQANNWDKASHYYLIASMGEHAVAAYKFGICLLNALGCEKNELAAYHQFILSAESNYKPAIFMVAECKRKGVGCPPNIVEAKSWYHRSALEGNSDACNILGELYEAEKEYGNAVMWYYKAGDCLTPSAKAKCNLGRCYYYGIGMEVEYEKAEDLFIEAINSNEKTVIAEAKYYYGIANEEGNTSKGKRLEKAFNLYKEAADQDPPYVETQYKVACCFKDGIGTELDLEKARQYFEKAASNGHAEAHYELGIYYRENNMVNMAMEHLQCAADNGHIKAAYELGCLYEGKEIKKALVYFKMASEKGHLAATYWYGRTLDNIGYQPSSLRQEALDLVSMKEGPCYKEATKRILKAADEGLAEAQLYVGQYLFNNCISGYDDYHSEHARRPFLSVKADITGFSYYSTMAGPGSFVKILLNHVGMTFYTLEQKQKKVGEQCVHYLQLAAEQDDYIAMFAMKSLGDIYGEGALSFGISYDKNKSFEWYRKAAELGNMDAISKLEELERGKG